MRYSSLSSLQLRSKRVQDTTKRNNFETVVLEHFTLKKLQSLKMSSFNYLAYKTAYVSNLTNTPHVKPGK